MRSGTVPATPGHRRLQFHAGPALNYRIGVPTRTGLARNSQHRSRDLWRLEPGQSAARLEHAAVIAARHACIARADAAAAGHGIVALGTLSSTRIRSARRLPPVHRGSAGRHLGRRGTTLPCSPAMPTRSSCACSTRRRTSCVACRCRTQSRGLARLSSGGTCPASVYGYRAHGPYAAASTACAQSAQAAARSLCARSSLGPLRWSDALFGYRVDLATRAICPSIGATAPAGMPKAVVTSDRFDWGDDRAPRTPWSDTGHLRSARARLDACGSTVCPRRCAAPTRRWPSGHRSSTCKRLGVTAIELLPIHAFVHDRASGRSRPAPTTGATTRSASSRPSRATCASAIADEIASVAMSTLHAAGIEVIARRGLQPHLRGQRARADAVAAAASTTRAYYRLQADNPRATSTTPAPATR